VKVLRIPLETVTQQDLEMVVGLDNQIRALRALRDEHCARILERLAAGCPVEFGHHSAELHSRNRGAVRVVRLRVDGRAVI